MGILTSSLPLSQGIVIPVLKLKMECLGNMLEIIIPDLELMMPVLELCWFQYLKILLLRRFVNLAKVPGGSSRKFYSE